jgi:hypothetical protein
MPQWLAALREGKRSAEYFSQDKAKGTKKG